MTAIIVLKSIFSFLLLVFIAIMIEDARRFSRSSENAITANRTREWLDQPNRMRLGSGFRLLKMFPTIKKPTPPKP